VTDALVIPQFAKRFMAGCNAHGWDVGQFAPEVADRLIPAWVAAEGNDAAYNPLSCTLWLPGATAYNAFVVNGKTFHVWNYKRAMDGLAAHIQTIANGNYNGILGDIQNGTKTAEQIVRDRWSQFKTWGTNPQTMLDLLEST
jgi:hypothetical protein